MSEAIKQCHATQWSRPKQWQTSCSAVAITSRGSDSDVVTHATRSPPYARPPISFGPSAIGIGTIASRAKASLGTTAISPPKKSRTSILRPSRCCDDAACLRFLPRNFALHDASPNAARTDAPCSFRLPTPSSTATSIRKKADIWLASECASEKDAPSKTATASLRRAAHTVLRPVPMSFGSRNPISTKPGSD